MTIIRIIIIMIITIILVVVVVVVVVVIIIIMVWAQDKIPNRQRSCALAAKLSVAVGSCCSLLAQRALPRDFNMCTYPKGPKYLYGRM